MAGLTKLTFSKLSKLILRAIVIRIYSLNILKDRKLNTSLTNIDGVIVIKQDIFNDDRGFFSETYSKEKYFSLGIQEEFVQDNHSQSIKNTLRGLHYQSNKTQGKLVRVLRGEVLDVAVDVRKDSQTFGKYFSILLNESNHYQLYMPPGIAHGFYVTSEFADFEYKCTDYYNPESEKGVLWSDPDLNIDWPSRSPIVSDKDSIYKRLKDIPKEDLL
jgi:dTDP-4-dehydrorhamnose 3,5-epimerase